MARSKQIIDKYFSQNAGKKTQGLFAEWFSTPIDEEIKDQLLQDQWEREYYLSPEDIEKSYKAVRRKIDISGRIKTQKSYRSLWIAVAAAAAVFAAVFISRHEREQSFPVAEDHYAELTECYVSNGEKQMITLADSTSVILNSGSLLI